MLRQDLKISVIGLKITMKISKSKYLKYISLKEAFSFLFVILLMFFFSILEVVSISTIPLFANYYFKKDFTGFIDEKYLFILEKIESIEFLSIFIICIFIFKNLFGFFVNFCQFSIVKKLLIKISTKLFSNILNRNYLFFANTNSSLVVRNLTHEIDQLGNYINSLFIFIKEVLLIFFLLIFIILSGYFFAFSYVLIIGFILFIFFKIYKKKIHQISVGYQSLKGKQIKNINDSRSLIQEIKIYNLFNFYNSNFNILQNNLEHLKLLKSLLVSIPRFIIEILFIISIISLIYITSRFYSNESIFSLIIFVSIISIRFIPLYGSLSSSIMAMKTNYPSVSLISNELEKKDKLINYLKLKKNKKITDNSFLKIENLNFTYNKKSRKVIKKLNFTINQHDFVGIVGPSGSGKTTLVNILCGLIYPDKGSIFNLGENIYNNLNKWQSKIGYVSSTSLILNESVIKNIVLDKKIDRKNIVKILRSLELDILIDKLNSKVGDAGSKLSSGQRQRLLIARVLYRDPEILIFDEVTNYLDIINEEKVLKLIKKLNKLKPVILITHKKSNLKFCNKIIKF